MTQYSGKLIRKTPLAPTQQSASGVWKLNEQAAAIRNNSWPVAGVPDPISRSVRLRSSASAYFNRTPAVAGNRQKFTWSAWVKLGSLTNTFLFSAGTSTSNVDQFYFNTSTNQLFFNSYQGAYVLNVNTNAVYRDPSAWYHIVLSVDTTQATSTNRIAIYVNGVSQALSTGTGGFGSQNQNCLINSTVEHDIGRYVTYTSCFDGYLTEINFIDGQALTPSSFGTTDAFTGAWVPMAYTGTYGTNGFYLNFKGNASTTTLGLDYSGNANNWTANNISLTAGVTYDSMLDVPTPWVGYSTTADTSAVTRGNYCVLNGANNGYGTTTLSQGNLYVVMSAPGATEGMVVGTIGITTGKWYWEVNVVSVNTTYGYPCTIGIGNLSTTTGVGVPATSYVYNSKDGNKLSNTGSLVSTAYGATYTANDVIGVAFDADAGTLIFYKNNTSQGTAFTGIASSTWFPRVGSNDGCTLAFNFGQRPLSYSPPSGFKTLCATNLPDPTIKLGAQYMAASLYTGTGATQSIVNSGNNTTATTFQPDLVWTKSRSAVTTHALVDSVRGAGKALFPSNTGAEDATAGYYVTSLNSNGFSVNLGTESNGNGNTYVGWQWKANGAAVSNTAGSITSQVSAGTAQGFSVVTYTGTGVLTTVGHGLGVAPNMIIVKARSTTGDWSVYTTMTGAGNYLLLDTTAASAASTTKWNNTSPTSTVFSVGIDITTNMLATTYVAYCWAQVAGFSRFGSYTGNGSTDGPFVYCGFRPRYVMIKRTDVADDWVIYDSARTTYNVVANALVADSSAAEQSGLTSFDFLSNGFKARATYSSENASGGTYIFSAFAENPFKYSNAR